MSAFNKAFWFTNVKTNSKIKKLTNKKEKQDLFYAC